MTSNAIGTQGFKFEIVTGTSPTVYTEVKDIVSFSGFDGSAAQIEITNLQSAAKEFLMGLQDFGAFKMSCNHVQADAGQVAMRAAKASRAKKTFRCTFSDTTTAIFDGYVLSNALSGGVDSKVEGSFDIRITGDVTFA